jgi:hypothetical protein
MNKNKELEEKLQEIIEYLNFDNNGQWKLLSCDGLMLKPVGNNKSTLELKAMIALDTHKE